MKTNQVLLNRPVFTQTAFDSRALTVLTTLLHRFPEAGRYQVRVQRGERREQQFDVQVATDHGVQQVNIDLATLNPGENSGSCGCEPKTRYELAVGGVMGFYVSEGAGRYSVSVSQVGEKEKRTLLDNRQGVPAGDFFAVTLTRPGRYRLSEENSRSEAVVYVSLPQGERLRADRPTLVVLGQDGLSNEVRLLSGQSLVVQCDIDALIRLELLEDETGAASPTRNGRYTVRKPRTPERKEKKRTQKRETATG